MKRKLTNTREIDWKVVGSLRCLVDSVHANDKRKLTRLCESIPTEVKKFLAELWDNTTRFDNLPSEIKWKILSYRWCCNRSHIKILLGVCKGWQQVVADYVRSLNWDGITSLQYFPHLVSLTAFGMSACRLSTLKFCTELQHLDLTPTLTDTEISFILAASLRSISINIRCGEDTLKQLFARCTSLASVSISFKQYTGKTHAWTQRLKQNSSLHTLSIPFISIKREEFQNICQISNLTHLDLNYSSVTNTVIKSLANLKMLRSLDIRYCKSLNNKGPNFLANIYWLQNLKISNVVGNSLDFLVNLKQLRSLTIDEPRNYFELNALRHTPELVFLDLNKCNQITSLENLKFCTRLNTLELGRIDCDISCLTKICTSLRHLVVNNIDKNSLDFLKNNLPKLEIKKRFNLN